MSALKELHALIDSYATEQLEEKFGEQLEEIPESYDAGKVVAEALAAMGGIEAESLVSDAMLRAAMHVALFAQEQPPGKGITPHLLQTLFARIYMDGFATGAAWARGQVDAAEGGRNGSES